MRFRYIIRPGYVTSENDGDRHYIGVPALERLYGLRPTDQRVLLTEGLRLKPQDILLTPRHRGDYAEHRAAQESIVRARVER